MNSKLDGKMEDKEYRDLFSESQIRRGVPLQIRAMRADRGWTQAELGEVAGMPQSVISRIENSRTINLSIRTLLKLARTFDVGLVVRFEPYSRLIDWADGLSATDMAVPSYDKEVASKKSGVSAKSG